MFPLNSNNSDSDSEELSDPEASDVDCSLSNPLMATFASGHIVPQVGLTSLCNFPRLSKAALACGDGELIFINTDEMESMAVLAQDNEYPFEYVVIDHLKW